MFDAIRRHDHDALHRALAAGATVQDRFVGETDSPEGAGMYNNVGGAFNFLGLIPVHYALLEDDPKAVQILLDADDGPKAIASRNELLRLAKGLAHERNVQCPKVVAMLETVVLRDTMRDTIDEPSTPSRPRARL